MNYPSGTVVQNYNVSAGRVIQLPCFADQMQPPDGFRAVVFATPIIGGASPYVNQTGPAFASGQPAAIQFDLTQLIQQAALSRARSIYVQCQSVMEGATTAPGSKVISYDVMLDSGLMIPCVPGLLQSDAFIVADFISANPIFGLFATAGATDLGMTAQFTVAVANFKLSAAGFSGGTQESGT